MAVAQRGDASIESPPMYRRLSTLPGILLTVAGFNTIVPSAMAATEPAPLRLTAPEVYQVKSGPGGVEVGDVTGDGREDAIFSTQFERFPGTGYRVFLFRQQADGTLADPVAFVPDGTFPRLFLDLGDAGDDGDLDVFASTNDGVDLFSQVGGTLTGPTLLPSPREVLDIEVGDLNDDGRDDIVYVLPPAQEGEKWVALMRTQLVDGGWSAATSLGLIDTPSVTVGDLNDDGRDDVFPETDGAPFSYFLQQADHSFTAVPFPHEIRAGTAVIGDVIGDGRTDIVAAGGSDVVVSQGLGNGTFAAPVTIDTWSAGIFQALELDDMNGDGSLDVLSVGTQGLTVWLGRDDGTLSAPWSYVGFVEGFEADQRFAIGDLDDDGQPDVATGTASTTNGDLYVQRQLPPGVLQPTEFDELTTGGGITYRVGDEVYVAGELRFPGGGDVDHTTVELWRTLPGGSPTKVATVAMRPFNQIYYDFWANDVAPVAGAITYTFRYTGDAIHAAGESPPLVIDVQRKVAKLSLSTSRSIIDFGDRATLRARFRGGLSNKKVSFFAADGTGPPIKIATERVNDDGVATVSVRPKRRTVYSARFAGDARWEPAEVNGKVVRVRVLIEGTMLRADHRSGAYAIYRSGQTVYFRTHVTPNHAGEVVLIYVNARVGGSWHFLGSVEVPLDDRSRAVVYIRPRDLRSGIPYRMSAEFQADGDHASARSEYVFFKVG